jgi:adenylylsulfate kinase
MAQTQGFTVWLTGMLGVGKSSLANYVAARLRQVGRQVEILDEDSLGDTLWAGLGDSKDERNVIVRRLGFLANVLSRNNVAVLVAATSPYKGAREENRRGMQRYVEVYVDCPTETLIQRDTTGQYKKALSGEIPNFIGITEPYEPPSSPEVVIESGTESIEQGGTKIFQALLDLAYVNTEDLKTITGKKMKANPLPKKGAAPTNEAARGRGKEAKAPAPVAAAAPTKGARKTRPAQRAARMGKSPAGKGKGR